MIRQRGRKSSAALVVFPAIDHRPPIDPPSSLTMSERALFIELAASAQHLRQTDAPLLASYVQAIILSRLAARNPSRIDDWERATRLQATLATKLRLTPQSRTDAKTVGRQQQHQGPAPWE